VPSDIVDKVLQIALALEVNYAGSDVAVTSRVIYVLEFNLYFGTRGIPFSSFELGKIIDRYLSETILEMNMGNQKSCYMPSENKNIAFAAEIL
jgi:glutathione synthase/RimK-type ligase-like ATP-grasp enzyme